MRPKESAARSTGPLRGAPAALRAARDARAPRCARASRTRSLAAVLRGVLFLAIWIVVSGWSLKDLPVGLVTAAGAAWISLKLTPPGDAHLHPMAMLWLGLDFLRESVVSGVDVARRALMPTLDLDPGYVVCRLRTPDGPARGAFLTLASLLPGTLPTGLDEQGRLVVHALDVKTPVAENLAAEEALFLKAVEP